MRTSRIGPGSSVHDTSAAAPRTVHEEGAVTRVDRRRPVVAPCAGAAAGSPACCARCSICSSRPPAGRAAGRCTPGRRCARRARSSCRGSRPPAGGRSAARRIATHRARPLALTGPARDLVHALKFRSAPGGRGADGGARRARAAGRLLRPRRHDRAGPRTPGPPPSPRLRPRRRARAGDRRAHRAAGRRRARPRRRSRRPPARGGARSAPARRRRSRSTAAGPAPRAACSSTTCAPPAPRSRPAPPRCARRAPAASTRSPTRRLRERPRR